MSEHRDWWRIRGVRPPAYTPSRRSYGRLLIIDAALLLATIIGEIINFLPVGTSVLVGTGLFIASFITRILGLDKTWFSKTDSLFLSSIVRELRDRIVYWSVPNTRIPLSAMLAGGLYLVVHYSSGYKLLIIKPVGGLRAVPCRPKVALKTSRRKTVGNKHVYLGRIIYPHPLIRGTCYQVEAVVLVLSQDAQPSQLREAIEEARYQAVEWEWIKGD